ncbi:MAG: 2-oxo-4-hydroxy-4-carboxy-5-ureidoimidazoline decarboxylase [Spirulinaceae cyanobacterium SM2_1_0]|nr:2-oxo-4-hydroxy-4-carboxy-5-ureidoimidazoline decarboxylase [Spirulinaceae cyanobacterium SM2_1_0]
MPYRLTDLNQMTQAEFVAALGEIFEQTPAIAAQAWSARPFASRDHLHTHLVAIVKALSPAQQLALIRAHPDLGRKAQIAAASAQEQAGAGLDHLTAAEYEQFQTLNQAYRDRFGFPFLIAVKEHDKHSILAAFRASLENSLEPERDRALTEIYKIARFRLEAIVSESPPSR